MAIRSPSRESRPAPVTAVAPAGARRFTVDIHSHALTPAVERLVAGYPQKVAETEVMLRTQGQASVDYNVQKMFPAVRPLLTSLELRLKAMDEMGVDMQVVSPSPTQYYYWAEPDLARDIVRTQNDDIARMCAAHPDRLAGLGGVALQHPELSLQQLDYTVGELGFKGVEISTAVNGLDLADPNFERFWAKVEDLGCLVFIHPLGTSLGERLNRHYLANIIGQPIETTIALSHLIFGGVLDRYPGLKICAAHGGGYLPTYASRSDHAWAQRSDAHSMQRPLSAYLKQIYFDSIVYTPQALRMLIDQVGASQVVIGTDFPFDMGDYDVHGLIDATPSLSENERCAILGETLVKLLGLRGRQEPT